MTHDIFQPDPETTLHLKVEGTYRRATLDSPEEWPEVTVVRVDTWDDELDDEVVIINPAECAKFADLYADEIREWLETEVLDADDVEWL